MTVLMWVSATALLLVSPPCPRVRLCPAKSMPRRWFLLALGAAVIPLVWLAPAAVIAGGSIIGTICWAVSKRRKRVQAAVMAEVTSTYIGFLLGDVRAGSPVPQALSAAADTLVHHESAPARLKEVAVVAARRARNGAQAADVLIEAKDTCPDLGTVGLVLRVAEHHGIPLVELLEQTQRRIDARLRHRTATTAALQGPQATALILAILPAFGLVLGGAMGANPVGFLLHTGLGGVLLVVGVGLACAGFVWSQAIIEAAAS